jgi:hypothetical protein
MSTYRTEDPSQLCRSVAVGGVFELVPLWSEPDERGSAGLLRVSSADVGLGFLGWSVGARRCAPQKRLGDDYVLPIERGGRGPVEPVAEFERITDPSAERGVVGPSEEPAGRKPVGRVIGHGLILTIAETRERRGHWQR